MDRNSPRCMSNSELHLKTNLMIKVGVMQEIPHLEIDPNDSNLSFFLSLKKSFRLQEQAVMEVEVMEGANLFQEQVITHTMVTDGIDHLHEQATIKMVVMKDNGLLKEQAVAMTMISSHTSNDNDVVLYWNSAHERSILERRRRSNE
ncbi:hypothetical protein DEO72_LG10g3167 [Vigna unguiculata]|uniref:Uncharacterized protein n=1 Tax=Vigna unguiculata TaxID=3917 RepID=A0A4D6NEY7_VIGUN|nr:hypothetical protein DEO72_LG10g3167 [Vigna unguiculata]